MHRGSPRPRAVSVTRCAECALRGWQVRGLVGGWGRGGGRARGATGGGAGGGGGGGWGRGGGGARGGDGGWCRAAPANVNGGWVGQRVRASVASPRGRRRHGRWAAARGVGGAAGSATACGAVGRQRG